MLFVLENADNGKSVLINDDLWPYPMAQQCTLFLIDCINVDDCWSEETITIPDLDGNEDEYQAMGLQLTDAAIVKILLKLYQLPVSVEIADLIEAMESIRSPIDSDN